MRNRSLLLPLALAACVSPATDRSAPIAGVDRPADPAAVARAVETVERLDRLRSGLARTFDGSGARPDEATFLLVCRPVGVESARIARENGWVVEQTATRWRNPDHAADPEARAAIERFERTPGLEGTWIRTERDGRRGTRYFRRIVVEPPCLSCHGAKGERPEFVKERYPDDRAHGFEVGDVRGAYAVFVPDSGSGGSPAPER